LADAPVVALGTEHPAMAVQRDILSILAAGSISKGAYANYPVSVEVFFRDVAALGQRILRYAEPVDLRTRLPDDLWGDIAPLTGREARRGSSPAWAITNHSSATVATAAACLAVPILLGDSPSAAGEQMRWLVASMRRRGLTVSASNVGWGRNVSDALVGVQLASLRAYLGPVDQLRHRGCAMRPADRSAATSVSRSLPALIWPRCAFRFETDGVGFDQLRAALSVAVMLVGSRIPMPAACAVLGSTTHERAVSRVLQRLRARADWEPCMATVIALRDELEAGAPIDYARRRTLDYADLLPPDRWHAICRDLDFPMGRSTRARLHRCWLYERLTGSPAVGLAPGRGDPRFRALLADLPRTLSPTLAVELENVGYEFLAQKGVRDEPLTWCPDMTAWSAGLVNDDYARALASIDVIHRHVADYISLGAIAEQTGTTIAMIREVLVACPTRRARRRGTPQTHR
jgi:hypothetical protein